MFHRIGRKLGQAEVAPLNGLCNVFGQRSVVTRLAPWAGWLSIALALAVLLSTVFGTMAQANSLPAAEMQAATSHTHSYANANRAYCHGRRGAGEGAAPGGSIAGAPGSARYGGQQLYPLRLARHCPHTRPSGRRRYASGWGSRLPTQLPSASFLEILFTVTLDTLDPEYKETAKSNFLAIARGGLSTEYLFLTCYVDFTASEYLLGAGPTTITLGYDRMGEAHSYELYEREHAAGQFGQDALLSQAAYQAKLDQIVWDAEDDLSGLMEGQDSVVFLAPIGAHNAIAIEAWQVVAQWDVVTVDGTVNVIRHDTYAGDPEHSQTLANLQSQITMAATSDDFANNRIADVSGLQAYYTTIGAYEDITPDDGQTTTFTPAQPLPMRPCANGTAVPNPRDNRMLVQSDAA